MLQGLGSTEPNFGPLPGLLLLQGMVVSGPQGQRREQYSRAASRSKATGWGGATGLGNKTAGIGELPRLQASCAIAALLNKFLAVLKVALSDANSQTGAYTITAHEAKAQGMQVQTLVTNYNT